MSKKYTAIQVGLGSMGKIITYLLLELKNLSLKGLIDEIMEIPPNSIISEKEF